MKTLRTLTLKFWAKIGLPHSPNQPASMGWAEMLTGLYVSHGLIITFAAAKHVQGQMLLWALSLGSLALVVAAVLLATRRGSRVAYYAALALLFAPTIKLMQKMLNDPQMSLDALGLPLLASLLSSLGAAMCMLLPSAQYWRKIRRNELRYSPRIEPMMQIFKGETQHGVNLFERPGWWVSASIMIGGEYNLGGLSITSGDHNKDWIINIAKENLGDLRIALRKKTKLLPLDDETEDDYLLRLLFTLFGGRAENPFEHIKAFLDKHNIAREEECWG